MAGETGAIPRKKYFRIGEVSKIVGVDPHVLRYWETEFPIIRPHRGPSRQRLYRRRDVENLLEIRMLLHDEGYTISGARRVMQKKIHRSGSGQTQTTMTKSSHLQEIKQELLEILNHCGLDRGDFKEGY